MIKGKKVLGLIPARGGSKSLPRKNVLSLGGRPLISWTIQAALASAYLDRVVASSDDREIMETARKWGAEVPFTRPAELAGDETASIDVVLHALDQVGNGYDYVVMLQPTSPLRTVGDIDACVSKCLDSGAPACVSVCEASKSPYWMYTFDSRERFRPVIQGLELITRRQDIPPVYSLNGAVYVARTDWLRKAGQFITPETVGYVMPHERSLDIDTALDLRICQILVSEKEAD